MFKIIVQKPLISLIIKSFDKFLELIQEAREI